ncbi:MAG: hypothetical protein IT291_07450 [Deltaproteobacteria bacterium]|nr:hypothetical protein [Deltaproteobacteria bacterium]
MAFFLAIPSIFILLILSLSALYTMLSNIGIDKKNGSLFCLGFFAGLILLSQSSKWLRTLLHEVKHAAMIVISGNILTDLQVHEQGGHVMHKTYKDKKHFGPFISLAPYFFPFFSLPTLVAGLVLDTYANTLFASLLGAAVAIDIVSAYRTLSPRQSDIQRIFGGVIFSYFFIFGFNILWILQCLIWIQGGRDGFVILGYKLLDVSELLSQYVREFLSD